MEQIQVIEEQRMTGKQANFYLFAENIERAVMFYQQNFDFKLEGQIEAGQGSKWAALRTDNALIWLGPNGAKNGLIILVENKLTELVDKLMQLGVTVFIPDEFQDQIEKSTNILETEWGKHAWILDSENNAVMLFEPAAG